MRLGFLSDIHGNLPALEEGFQRCDVLSDQVVCLGDLVGGYGYDDECVDFIQGHGLVCVAGNHDVGCLRWGLPELREDNMEYLRSLPAQMEVEGILLTHDTPLDISDQNGRERWESRYIDDHLDASHVFSRATAFQSGPRIVVVGHTHIPAVFSEAKAIPVVPGTSVCLSANESYILNPGAIGYSRASHDAVNFALLDTDNMGFLVCDMPVREERREVLPHI